jgi:hypothetical protein
VSAASSSSLAKARTAALRSIVVIPHKLLLSSAIVVCRGDGGAFCCVDLIAVPQGDGRVALEFCPETKRGQQAVQVRQSRDRDTRRTDLHVCAGNCVQHPGRDHCHHTGRYFDMDHVTAGAALATVPTQLASIKRMPSIMDDDLLLDMGRMTPR